MYMQNKQTGTDMGILPSSVDVISKDSLSPYRGSKSMHHCVCVLDALQDILCCVSAHLCFQCPHNAHESCASVYE